MAKQFLTDELDRQTQGLALEAGRKLAGLLDADHRVGDLTRLDYDEAVAVVHDRFRSLVGGLPLGAFLVATRISPSEDVPPDPEHEDTSLVLLRVVGSSPLPDSMQMEHIRYQGARRAVPTEHTWDTVGKTDQWALNELRYSGLRCRVLGTFIIRQDERGQWVLTFGADLANFYSGKGMKVYKPGSDLLHLVVNFVRPARPGQKRQARTPIRLGRVRYAASERTGDDTVYTAVEMDPTDLIARRTALFGMSRTGKSNTTKIIASSVFRLRGRSEDPIRVGQLILDPNGEYANDTAQDRGSIKVVATSPGAKPDDVVTYGLTRHPKDPERRLIKLNFLGVEPRNWDDRETVVRALEPLIQGKQVIDSAFKRMGDRKYVTAFTSVSFEVPEEWEGNDNRGVRTRFRRNLTAYRALLTSCRFVPGADLGTASLVGLTNPELRTVLQRTPDYASAAASFARPAVSWSQAFDAFKLLGLAMLDKDSGYAAFNLAYQNKPTNVDARNWHDEDLTGILAFMNQRGGLADLGRLSEQHDSSTSTDYADDIVSDLRAGRLVIVDQSTGDPELTKTSAERLMWRIFNRQKDDFVNATLDQAGNIVSPPDIVVYVEEAHNLLPAKSDDLTTVWSRTAKEGSKFRIGLAYATQEPSSIQPNILKNTDNWFVAHLNNADELRELRKYYDFADFEKQILNVPEPGFLRMRTLSNSYVIPVQVDEFIGGA